METGKNGMSGYGDLALGFVGGINSIAPLISAFAPDLKMAVRIVLEDTGAEAFMDLGSRPPKVSFGKVNRPAEITLWAKAKDFHDILRGKLNLIKAMNDKRILVEMIPTAFANIPNLPPAKKERPLQVPGFVYDMYLVSIGASRMLEEPSPPDGKVRLEPGEKGMFARFSGVVAWFFGVIFGVIFKIWNRLRHKPSPDEVPQIEWREIDKVPAPGPSLEPPKIIRAIMKWFFNKVDMFQLAESFVNGARVIRAI